MIKKLTRHHFTFFLVVFLGMFGQTTARADHNLSVTFFELSATTAQAGDTITAEVDVDNLGTGESLDTTLRVFRSTNDIISTLDTELVAVPIGSIDPGDFVTRSGPISVGNDVGTLFFGACVDDVSDADSSNLCSDAVAVTITAPGPSQPPVLGSIRNLAGFSTSSLGPADDESSAAVPIGFSVNFLGSVFTTVFVNNNGSITFDQALDAFTPAELSSLSRQIIAPFFADVDTEGLGSGTVTFGNDVVNGRPAFGVNYINVGYYDTNTSPLNSFQVVLIDRSDTGAGNFDIEFNYGSILWESGDLSGGVGGLGGDAARAGFSNGSGQPGTFFEIPGSGVSSAYLDGNFQFGLANTTNVAGGQPGRFLFPARSGLIGVGAPPVSQPTSIAAAVLPTSRAVQVGNPATVAATISNGGSVSAVGCRVTSPAGFTGTLSFRTTDPVTNIPVGQVNQPATIGPAANQTFVVSIIPSAASGPTEISIAFDCDNTVRAPVSPGVNTLLLSAAATPVPDMVALAATPANNGIVDVPVNGTGTFAVATSNVGSTGQITAIARANPTALPMNFGICQTDTTTGLCLSTASPSATAVIAAGGTASFGIFVGGQNQVVDFRPASNRVVVEFVDANGSVRGRTSVAVRTTGTPSGGNPPSGGNDDKGR